MNVCWPFNLLVIIGAYWWTGGDHERMTMILLVVMYLDMGIIEGRVRQLTS